MHERVNDLKALEKCPGTQKSLEKVAWISHYLSTMKSCHKNHLAGGKVVPSPVVTDKPKIEEVIDPILEEIPDLYPSSAVTLAMTQKAKLSKPPITNSVHLNTTWPIPFNPKYFLTKIMVIVPMTVF